MEAAPDLAASVVAVRAISARFQTSSDEELVPNMSAVGTLDRMVDGLRLGAATEHEHRSHCTLGGQGLAARLRKRAGVALVQHLTGVSHRTARSRVGLGAILLCIHHHHLVHDPDSPVEIRTTDNDLWIVPRHWRGPLHEHRRRQHGPPTDPALDHHRRQHDPARNPHAA